MRLEPFTMQWRGNVPISSKIRWDDTFWEFPTGRNMHRWLWADMQDWEAAIENEKATVIGGWSQYKNFPNSFHSTW
jgi:hypothetical protein